MTETSSYKNLIAPHLRPILTGAVADYGTSFVILTINFVSVAVYLHYLSAAQFGVWIAIMGFLYIINLADPGLSLYVTKRLAEDSLFQDTVAAKQFVSAAQLVQVLIVVALTVAAGLLYLVGFLQSHTIPFGPVAICIGSVLVDIGCSVNTAILMSRMRFADVYVTNMLRNILGFVSSTILLVVGFELFALAWGTLAASLLANLIIYIRRRSLFPNVSMSLVPWTSVCSYIREGKTFIWSSQLLRTTQLMRQGSLPILFNLAAGPVALSHLNISARVSQIIPVYISKLAIVVFPYLSSMGGSPQKEAKTLFFYFNAVVLRLALLFTAILWALNAPFVTLWVGKDYIVGNLFFILIIITMWRECLYGCAGVFLYANGRFDNLARICLLDMAVSIGGGYFAARQNHSYLVLVFSIVGSTTTLTFIYIAILRHYSVRLVEFAAGQLYTLFRYASLPTIASLALAYYIRSYFPIDGWIDLASAAFVIVLANLATREIPLFIFSPKTGLRNKILNCLQLPKLRSIEPL